VHFIPAAIATFPIGTVGVAVWLFDPLDRIRSLFLIASLLLSPFIQIHLWHAYKRRNAA
jgi:hypothetical protein